MTAEARLALALIQNCLESDRFAVTTHFARRMQERALFWPDVEAVIDDPTEVLPDGIDEQRRAKWKISGLVAEIGNIEIVCAIESLETEENAEDESETEFITLYWEE